MSVQLEDMLALLPHGESIDLDYKRTFPPNYFDRLATGHSAARAELVKDVAAMANAASERPGCLVYGIADQNGSRVIHPTLRTQPEDDSRLAQLFDRYLDPPPNFEYAEFLYEQQLVGLLRVYRQMPYPHVIRESLGGHIHRGQVYVRRNTRTIVALYTDLVEMMEGRKPMVLPHNSPEAEKVSRQLQEQGWHVSWVPDYHHDQALLNGSEYVYFPSTRRYIVAPTGNPAGMFQEQYLMRRKPTAPD